MKKFCFLVQCLTHSNELSGRLAILMTDNLKVNHVDEDDASRFAPGTYVGWVPLTNGSCSAMIVADLRSAGYDDLAHEKHVQVLRGMPDEWTKPAQFVEAKEIYISII